jgi:hypothetical protein
MRLKSTLFVFAAIVYLAAASGASAQQHEQAVIMGAGVSTCGEFAEVYRRDPAHVMAYYFAWAQGAMSTTNMLKKAINQPQRDLNALPVSEQMDRLRMWCDKRPLSHFGDAVLDLFYELPQISPHSN